jgi:hypothetical protein
MSTVLATTSDTRLTFLQRLRMLFRRAEPKAEPLPVAQSVKAPEVMPNLKYTPGVSFDYAQLGGQA